MNDKYQYKKERRKWLREHGLCVWCEQNRAEEGKALCYECACKSADYSSQRWEDMPPEGKRRVYDRHNELQRAKREFRRKNGLCTNCGKSLQSSTFLMCVECRKKRRAENARRRRKLGMITEEERHSGQYCSTCCKPIPSGPFKVCSECHEKHKEALRKARESPEYKKHQERWRKMNSRIFNKEVRGFGENQHRAGS